MRICIIVPPLIGHLYPADTCESIRALWADHSSRPAIQQAIGMRLMENEAVLPSGVGRAIDMMMLTCMTSKFAESEDECATVAVLVVQQMRAVRILPMVTEDKGLAFAGKALVSLAFFHRALERRCLRHGAPSPDYYRKVSQLELRRHDHDAVAIHHSAWEVFLSEVFV